MSGHNADVVQVVLYVDVPLEGALYRREHYVVPLNSTQVDIAEAMGVGHQLLFPADHGIKRAAALAPYLDAAIVKLRDFPTDYDCVSLAQRLRELVLACDRSPDAAVLARTVLPP